MAEHDLLETNTRIRRLLTAVVATVVVAGDRRWFAPPEARLRQER